MLYISRVKEKGNNNENRYTRLYKSRVSQRLEKGDNKASRYRGCTNQRYRKGRGMTTIMRTYTICYTNQGYRRSWRRATIKRADTEAVQIKGKGEGQQ